MNSREVNWSETGEQWEYVGARAIFQDAEQRKAAGEDDVYPDDEESANMPMMNYAYPLNREPSENKILRVCKETNCTVVYNREEEKYYLALTGGGMDLSQDIALAYIIAQGYIDWASLEDIATQPNLSIGDKAYRLVMRELKRQLKISINNQRVKIKEINKAMQEEREKRKAEKEKGA